MNPEKGNGAGEGSEARLMGLFSLEKRKFKRHCCSISPIALYLKKRCIPMGVGLFSQLLSDRTRRNWPPVAPGEV